jgi:hypothetical protein
VRVSLLLLIPLFGCSPPPPKDGFYFGTLDAPCYEVGSTQAQIWNGHFTLAAGQAYRHIDGTIAPDGQMTGRGEWADDQGMVHATFEGSIFRPMFGQGFSGRLDDGRCNPTLNLYPPKLK